MTKMFLLGLLLVSPTLFAHEGDTADWGYIRIDNEGGFIISSKCYDRFGGGGKSSWKRTYAGGFRSCHGAYMRVDVQGGGTQRLYFKRSFHCGPSQAMHVKMWGELGAEHTSVSCK